jgi:hypothetical protein
MNPETGPTRIAVRPHAEKYDNAAEHQFVHEFHKPVCELE